MYIYKIIDNTNGNCYIGQTFRMEIRLRQHTDRKSKKVSCKMIIDNGDWSYKILEECDDDIAYEREQYWMDNSENVINIRNAVRKISKKDYNRAHSLKRGRWIRSWGSDKSPCCLWHIDPNLFQ